MKMSLVNWYSRRQGNTHVEIAVDISQANEITTRRGVARYTGYISRKKIEAATDDSVLAFSAFGGEGSTVDIRNFSNQAYQTITLQVTQTEFHDALTFAYDHIGEDYDTAAASWRLMIWPPRHDPDNARWWCCSFAHAILQQANILVNYRINTIDVDDLVREVDKERWRHVSALVGTHATAGMLDLFTIGSGRQPDALRGLALAARDITSAAAASCQHR